MTLLHAHTCRPLTGLVIVWCWTLPALGQSELADLAAIERAFVALAERVRPTVVAIETEFDAHGGRDWDETPMVGSGVIIDRAGLIATNDHVVRSADRISVVVEGGRRYQATIAGRDERTDLAVIRIDPGGAVLAAAPLGDLGGVRVGQWAFAVGNPFGTAKDGRPSMSFGIVSALGKSLPSLENGGRRYYGNLIQTTADINPGNSGGPLFNIAGQVIGINTAIETRSGVSEGLGYAIPVSQRTRDILGALARGRTVEHGFLGVSIEEPGDASRPQVADGHPWGVVVTQVHKGSPADMARLQPMDLIYEYDRIPVRGVDHLIRLVAETPAGQMVPVRVYRDGRPLDVDVTVGRRDLGLAGSR